MRLSPENAKALVRANALLLVLLLMHVADHARQGHDVPLQVTIPGLSSQVLLLGALWLAARRHPLAPEAAIALGFGVATGFVLVHLLPTWWTFSDAYPDADVDALSWIQALACVAAALWLGRTGARARRRAIPSATAAS